LRAPPAADCPADLDGIFRRYAPYVAAIAHRLLGRDHEVDDAVQDVFTAAVRGIGALRDPDAAKAWLARVCVRVARRRLQRRRMRALFGLDEAAKYESVADDSASPEDRALIRRIYGLLDELPADERVAWALRYVEGERLEAVATLCGCSLATAKRRISAAARKLEEALKDD
jgi:RNA polymerase sigma-70 factor (ECF subfamily)